MTIKRIAVIGIVLALLLGFCAVATAEEAAPTAQTMTVGELNLAIQLGQERIRVRQYEIQLLQGQIDAFHAELKARRAVVPPDPVVEE